MKKNVLLAFACLSSTLFLGSCCGGKSCTKESAENSLEGEWKIVSIGGQPVSGAEAEPTITFNMAEKRVSGNAGCNNYFAGFELSDKRTIKFDQAGVTRMMCADMKTEQAFLEAFNNISQYEVANNEICFKDKAGHNLIKATKK